MFDVDTKKTSWNRKWKMPNELEQGIDRFFRKCKRDKMPFTISGLALALNTNRQTLLEYEGRVEGREKGEEFAVLIKRAKLICENYAEQQLFIGKNVVGAIFVLKNNYNWKDRKEVTGEDGSPLVLNVVNFDGSKKNDSNHPSPQVHS